jgi:hypothetical protein
MNRFAAALLGAALAPALLAAQEQGWAAKFFTNGVTHDFGKVAYGQQLAYKFTITNIYNVPFSVTSATVSCGCVTPKKPTGVIPPRGTAELEVSMDTRKIPLNGKPWPVKVFVSLASVPENPTDKRYSSMATLIVSSQPQSNVLFSADKISMGNVSAGQSVSLFLDIAHRTDPNWTITGVAEHNYPVDIKVERMQPAPGWQAAYRIFATLKKDAPAGDFKFELVLNTSDKAVKQLPLVIDGNVQALLAAVPNQVDLGNVKVGEVVTRNVIIKGPGKPFKITEVDGADDGLTVKFKKDEARVNPLLTIEFIPKKEGKLTKTLTIKTDLGKDLSATVAIEGNGTP